MLDTRLLAACISVVVATVLYLFYWNRFIGFIITLGVRAVYWTQGSSSIWVEIGSFHVSLLSGRLFLKDIKYHSSNQTIKIVKACIIWQYWIRRPASEEDLASLRRGNDETFNSLKHPCRVQIDIDGLEWFIYNRTAAYDAIVRQMAQSNTLSRPSTMDASQQHPSSVESTDGLAFLDRSMFLRSFKAPPSVRKAVDWLRKQLPHLDPIDLLPLGIHVSKGAIVCGNQATPNLLAVDFKTIDGAFGIVQSRSRFDLYKQILSLVFQRVVIHYVHNHEYREPMPDTGKAIQTHVASSQKRSKGSPLSYSSFLKSWRSTKLYKALFSKKARRAFRDAKASSEPDTSRKKHSIDESLDPTTHEYAIERRIIEAPVFELSYYADVVGDVPRSEDNPHFRQASQDYDIGNGDIDPEWGIDMIVRRGVVRYGPWADRQRAELQRAFFPPTYQDVEVTPTLKPGDKRQWTDMRVFIELRDETTLEIPFREASKNWQWDGLTDVPNRPKKREAASIHLKVGDCSSISYMMPMVARSSGYDPSLEVHLDTISMTSSLNDIRLVTAESGRIRCELPSPLEWNAHREWDISISLRQPVLYLLRDHINMFTDLGKDWASGPPTDYHRFVPITYKTDLQLYSFILNLYCNDLNIVDKPLTKEENAFLIFHGDHLRNTTTIPSDTYRPEFSNVSFRVDAPNLSCDMALPQWHTHFTPMSTNLAKAEKLSLDGSFLYYAEVHEDNIDQLTLSFSASHLAYKAIGWSIRYFMLFQANYFGSYTHYTTLSEFLRNLQMPGKKFTMGDPVDDRYRPGKSNIFQVELDVDLKHGVMVLPAGLPGFESRRVYDSGDIGTSLLLDLPELQIHLRLHDHFMEMSLNAGPLYGRIDTHCPARVSYSGTRSKQKPLLVIDELSIVANRLFGPPPRTTTYICIWEIVVGKIHGVLSAAEVQQLAAVGNAFKTNFNDVINTAASEFQPPTIPDVTFLQVSLSRVDVIWNAGRAALAIALDEGLKLSNNDIGALFHKKLTSIRLPHLSVKVLLDKSLRGVHWLEVADLVLDMNIDIYTAPAGWRLKAFEQVKLVEREDAFTGRFQQILHRSGRARADTHHNGLYLPPLALPELRRSPKNVEPLPPRDSQYLTAQNSFASMSESDLEDSTTLAERDARLAHMRSLTPRPVNSNLEDDDNHFSTGDETDDADLSDGSDMSDYDSDEDSLPPSLLKKFSRVSRSYKSNHLRSPGLWQDSPFILSRDGQTLRSPSWKTDPLPHIDVQPPMPKSRSDEDDEHVSTTFVCLRSSRGLYFRMSPLLLWSTLLFQSDLEQTSLSPELFLDNLLATAMGKIPDADDQPLVSLFFDVDVSQIRAHILQDVTLSEEVFLGSKPSPQQESQPYPAIVVLGAECRGIRTTGRWASNDRQFSIATESFSLNLSTAVSEQMVPFSSNTPSFTFYLSDILISIAYDGVSVLWNELSTRIGHHGPEYVLAFLKSAVRSLKPVKLSTKKWKSYRKAHTYKQLLVILQRSPQHVDRLSIVQPSYLVQHDVPRFLREDPETRLLFSLREGFGTVTQNPLPSVPPDGQDSFKHLVEELLLQRLERLIDPTEFSHYRASGLEAFLPPRPYDEPDSVEAKRLLFFKLRMQRLSIIVLDPQTGEAGLLSLQELAIQLRIRPLSLQSTLANRSYESASEAIGSALERINISLVLSNIELVVFPSLMGFAQHVVRVQRRFASSFARLKAISQKPNPPLLKHAQALDIQMTLGRACIRAIAVTLTFEVGISRVQLSLASFSGGRQSGKDHSSVSLLFGDIFLHARNPQSRSYDNEADILASLILRGGKANLIYVLQSSGSNLRAICSMGGFDFTVPRSALRLYRFANEWQESFLPAIEATAQELMSEIRQNLQVDHSPKPAPSTVTVHALIQLASMRVSLQVMPGTWLSWDIHGTLLQTVVVDPTSAARSVEFAAKCASQVVAVRAMDRIAKGQSSETRLKLALPSISVKGTFGQHRMTAFVLVDFITVTVKPSHWDTFLAVQQKFGQDFNDLVSLVQETRSRRAHSQEPKSPNSTSAPSLTYQGYLKMRGFRVGLRAASSALYLECYDVQGDLDNLARLKWHLAVTDLALSLIPRAKDSATQIHDSRQAGFKRDFKTAFVIIDFKVSAAASHLSDAPNDIALKVTKIHAVMQPSSVSEFGDFADHLQAEIVKKQDERRAALKEFKDKTQNVLKTFDVKLPDVKEVRKPSLLQDYSIDIGIHNIGVAFPLAHDLALDWPSSQSTDTTPVRAFLFSIKSIRFSTHRGETGHATVDALSFQFIPRFRQAVASDFVGDSHRNQNRLFYPSMQAQLRSKVSGASRSVWITADVSGFILDLDPMIPDYVFSLIDVYRQGKERVARFNLMTGAPKVPASVKSRAPSNRENLEPDSSMSYAFGFLTFRSGKVRMHTTRSAREARQGYTKLEEPGIDIFKLPVVSVWSEYRSSPTDRDPAMLVFKSTVHSSENTLTPELLPFLADLMKFIEDRLRETSGTPAPSFSSSEPSLKDPQLPDDHESGPPLESSMHISFSLRIDQSKLQLTCQPDVNVIAGLHWDSGGFIVNVSPGARRVTFTGTVGGLTVGLKHGFLTEDCVRLDARNLAFSIAFTKQALRPGGIHTPTVSIVVQSEIHGVARFSRLQDILCFKAVWLDRIPTFNTRSATSANAVQDLAVYSAEQPMRPFITAILVRIRQIRLQIDLGHSISTVTIDLRDAVLRTKLTESVNEVAVSLDDLSIGARGNIAGHANVSNCVFQTVRRLHSLEDVMEVTQMLEMRLTSSALTASLESEHQKLVHYRAEPLEVAIFDDYSQIMSRGTGEHPLQLSFTVAGPEIVAVITVSTIPILLKYVNVFKANLELQREAASRESKTFQRGHVPQPENPLSAVAEAMIQSARNGLQDAGSSFYTMKQHISFGLKRLRLVVYPRTIGDMEAAELLALGVVAELDGTANQTEEARRQLHLSFESLSISKYTRTSALPPFDDSDGKKWLASLHNGAAEANIVGLPAMDILMESEETKVGDHSTTIIYDFDSRFDHNKRAKERSSESRDDIFITLNMGLYVWLTGFRKAFQRGMEEADKARTRTINSTASLPSSKPKKLDNLQIQVPNTPASATRLDGPRSAMVASPPSLSITPVGSPFQGQAKTAIGGETFRSATGDETLSSPVSDGQSPTDKKAASPGNSSSGVVFQPRNRRIERLTMRQLGEATPDLTHPFFKKTAGFTLEDSLPQLVHEYATVPLEQIMEALLRLYTRQLLAGQRQASNS